MIIKKEVALTQMGGGDQAKECLEDWGLEIKN